MPYIIDTLDNANLGWMFYKKYFDGKNTARDKIYDESNRDIDTLANRNYTITQRVTPDNSQYFNINDQYEFPLLYTTYPGLLIGSGYTHEYGEGIDKDDAFKIGFFFDHTTGLPCLPGHGVKGALRAAFPNHKNEKYKDEKSEWLISTFGEMGVDVEKKFEDYLSGIKITGVKYSATGFAELLGAIIFEGKRPSGVKSGAFLYEQMPLEGRDIFYDAYLKSGNDKNHFLGNDYITAHEHPLKAPNPVQFLKILPGIGIQFQFGLKSNLITANEKETIFLKILLNLGAGAKTNVGYGQFVQERLLQDTSVKTYQKDLGQTRDRSTDGRGKNYNRNKDERPEYNSLDKYKDLPKPIEEAKKETESNDWPNIAELKKKEGSITAKIIAIDGNNLIVQPYIKGLADGYTIKINLGRFSDAVYELKKEIKIQLTQKTGLAPNFILEAKILSK